ncbi:SDR family NAD(P)-dependent oxidoreductase [Virgibacillus oceani]
MESYIAAPGSSAYSISKGALLMLTKQAASDYFKDNIRVNIVCPCLIDNKILDGAPVSREELASYVPIGRFGKPEEIAPLFAYLASEESSFVTGSSFTIDGGQTSV